ncbi:hypothetical protein [Nitrincola tapanii]|uniref:Uncharacterized protein n=1 Tax=Nitrincola tapanii TaxID=1708751 RepID=A0A5A9W2T3_9GAMM|nr:hypothetical protein [Nitrincola tapanii]KAA0875056.1 hypothetical protein E1H14_06455 [Nitrincola tapanii]
MNKRTPSVSWINRVLLILVLLLGLLLLWQLPRFLQDSDDATHLWLTAWPCDLHQGVCSAERGQIQLSLSMTPRPLVSLQPLDIHLELQGVEADWVQLDLQGVEMYMGLNQTLLQSVSSADAASTHLWSGQTELAVCTTGEMTWRAQVIFSAEGQMYRSAFEFDAR